MKTKIAVLAFFAAALSALTPVHAFQSQSIVKSETASSREARDDYGFF